MLYSGESSIRNFLQNVRNNNKLQAKMYFGEIDNTLADAIREQTGYEWEGRNVSLRADNIRNIDKTTEKDGDTYLPPSDDDYVKIPEIVGNPDSLSKSLHFGKPGVSFERSYDTGIVRVFLVESGPESADVYIRNIKKGSIANVTDVKSPAQTSETLVGTTPNDNIPDIGIIVNRSNKYYSGKPTITMGYRENRTTYITNNETIAFAEAREKSKLDQYENNKKDITGPVTEFYKQFQNGIANQDNYYSNTIAEYEARKSRPRGKPDFVSINRSGEVSSEYWYKNDGVIRGSDHWGANIASCSWFLNNSEKASGKRYGFAKWSDFIQKTDIITSEDGRATISTFDNTIGAIKGRHGASTPIVKGYNDKKYQGRTYTLSDLEESAADTDYLQAVKNNDPENEDIRYQERTYDMPADEDLMMNASAKDAANIEQGRLLKEYQERVE